MWESRSGDFQGLWETDGKPAFGLPRFPQPVISTALFAVLFMLFAFVRKWQTASVLLSASVARSPCRSLFLPSGSSPPQSDRASCTAPGPAVAAGSPTVSRTNDKSFSACPWRRSPLQARRRAGENSAARVAAFRISAPGAGTRFWCFAWSGKHELEGARRGCPRGSPRRALSRALRPGRSHALEELPAPLLHL